MRKQRFVHKNSAYLGNSDFLLYLRISNDVRRLILTSLYDLITTHYSHYLLITS
jgi:hypothetical protein